MGRTAYPARGRSGEESEAAALCGASRERVLVAFDRDPTGEPEG